MDEKFCTEVLLRNLLANAPTHDETGKLSVFLKTASEEDLQSLSKPDTFFAEVNNHEYNRYQKDCLPTMYL